MAKDPAKGVGALPPDVREILDKIGEQVDLAVGGDPNGFGAIDAALEEIQTSQQVPQDNYLPRSKTLDDIRGGQSIDIGPLKTFAEKANDKRWFKMVVVAQKELIEIHGDNIPKGFKVDGIYGPMTSAAVAEFQRQHMPSGSYKPGEMDHETYKRIVAYRPAGGRPALATSQTPLSGPPAHGVSRVPEPKKTNMVVLGDILPEKGVKYIIDLLRKQQEEFPEVRSSGLTIKPTNGRPPFDIGLSEDNCAVGLSSKNLEIYEQLLSGARALAKEFAGLEDDDQSPAAIQKKSELESEWSALEKKWKSFHEGHTEDLFVYHRSQRSVLEVDGALREMDIDEFVRNFPIPAYMSGDLRQAGDYFKGNYQGQALGQVLTQLEKKLRREASSLSQAEMNAEVPTLNFANYIREQITLARTFARRN